MGEVTPLCIFERRFTGFDARPRVATPRDTITVAGKLEYHATPFCLWLGAGGDLVELYIDGVRVSHATTESDGSFRFSVHAGDIGLGKHVVWCIAPWTWRGCYAKSSEITVEVVTEDEKKRREFEEFLRNVALWGSIGAVVLGCVLVGLHIYERERRMEMMKVMAMMKK
jgi:hypothetical protein